MGYDDDFDEYVQSLPTMLTLLSDAVDVDHAPTTPYVQDLRTALRTALAAAERLRFEYQRKFRRQQSKSNDARAHLHLVPLTALTEAS